MAYKKTKIGEKVIVENLGGYYSTHVDGAEEMKLKRWEKNKEPNLNAIHKVVDYIPSPEGYKVIFGIENIQTKEQYVIDINSLRFLED